MWTEGVGGSSLGRIDGELESDLATRSDVARITREILARSSSSLASFSIIEAMIKMS